VRTGHKATRFRTVMGMAFHKSLPHGRCGDIIRPASLTDSDIDFYRFTATVPAPSASGAFTR